MPFDLDLQAPQTAYQLHVFEPYAKSRARVIHALEDAAAPDPSKRAEKLRTCCQFAAVHADDDTDEPHIREQRCKSRLCPRCAIIRSRAIIPRLIEAMARMDAPSMLTLTLRSTDTPLRAQVQRLTACFKKLRKAPIWGTAARGGIYTIEVTWNHSTHRWHPHLHALIDADYIPQSALAERWHTITGDSRIVDIRRVNSKSDAAKYVAGYVAKSSDVRDIPDHCIPEWAEQLHGMRLVQTFGSLHGVKLKDDDDEEREDNARYVAAAMWLADDAAKGDQLAKRLLELTVHPPSRLPRPHPPRPSKGTPPGKSPAAYVLRAWSRRSQAAHDPVTPYNPDTPASPTGGHLWAVRVGQDDHSPGGDRELRAAPMGRSP